MGKILTYKLIQSGYDIYVSVDGLPPEPMLHQPEPYIMFRKIREDESTDYDASAQAHIDALYAEWAKEEAEAQNKITTEEKVKALEVRQMESEVEIDYRLSLIELDLI